MFHDHVPMGTTTDGMEPGGNMAILAYKSLLDEKGMPKMHDELFDQVFAKIIMPKKCQFGILAILRRFGRRRHIAPNYLQIIIFGLVMGLIIGLLFLWCWFINGNKSNESITNGFTDAGHYRIASAMNHGGMLMDEKGMIMNANSDGLSRDCPKFQEMWISPFVPVKNMPRNSPAKCMPLTSKSGMSNPAPKLTSPLSTMTKYAIN